MKFYSNLCVVHNFKEHLLRWKLEKYLTANVGFTLKILQNNTLFTIYLLISCKTPGSKTIYNTNIN